jgi:competence ComEA-like helix-hairpin-helix protein
MARTNINTATVEQLAAVPGLNVDLAERIVEHREEHGPFATVDDLLDVDVIDERTLARARPHLTTGPPEDETVDVVLRKADGSAGDYTGHTVGITGVRRGDDDIAVPFAASGAATPAGTLTLGIPARETLEGDVELRVQAPDGSVLAVETTDGPQLDQEVTIKVDPKAFGTTQPNTDPAAGRPTRVRGQVIDAAGQRTGAGLQVVLWGAAAEDPQDADFRALVVVTTDGLGHFTGPYPLGTFTAAHATVGLPDGPATVPIHLDDGAFPESVLLVLELPEPEDEDEDCACKDGTLAPRSPDLADLARADGTFSTDAGAGRCVDFTKPDRTLEEYSFSYVVRTTEPDIRGLTLDEPRKIPGKVIGGFLPELVVQPPIVRALARESTTVRERVEPAEIEERAAIGAAAFAGAENLAIDARVLRSLTRDPERLSADRVRDAAVLSLHGDLQRLLGTVVARPPGRRRLDADNIIDWDDDPTIYQAVTVAHGHLLRFKQEWVADGYSMGNLLYSLPLAPGQKKQIAVVDWERRETTTRDEFREARDSLEAMVDRDRDISEIVSGTLRESSRGGSSSSSGGFAAGLGIGAIIPPVGGLLGVGGGFSSADSSAWQNSSRQTSANALNQLRDRTVQSASSVRSQRTSVVSTVSQGERVTATTESVANYNHCHAITIQYFEVLRHLLVRQRVVDVQECLFVPMLMSWFTSDKALRWRNALAPAVPLRLRGGFDALGRIAASYVGSDLPVGRYADENLESVEGELILRFQLARPRDKDDGFDAGAWSPLVTLFGFNPADFYNQFLREQANKDRIFLQELGPKIVGNLVDRLQISAVRADDSEVDLNIDPTLLSGFANDRGLSVSLRMTGALSPVKRAEIKAVVIKARLLTIPGTPFVFDVLPAGSRVIVESGSLRYRTGHLSDALFRDVSIRNDLTGTDDVRIETPLNRQELRNPREEDKERARELLDHLNENLERFHHVVWKGMGDDRRYLLLDGFEAPNSGGRSVASVVENELAGIVGNCLVLPVARGFHLDPTFNQDVENPVDLLEHYQPNTPIEPSRVALPTRGVYAEAVMGACNSCEVIDETRFWRWSEEPIPDSPTQILPLSTESRRATPADVTPTELPLPIIAMQNAPAAPDPTGVGAALQLLGQAGAFRDITGLEGTQKNAAAALQQAFETATTFGTKAADLALQAKMNKDIDKTMKTIGSAKQQGLIDDKQAAALTETAIRGMVGAGATNPKEASTTDEVKQITKAAGEEKAAVAVTRPTGEKVEVDARGNKEDAGRPIIILGGSTASPDHRAFRPSANDKSLIIEVEASHRFAPEGSRLRWSAPQAGTLQIDNPDAPRTKVRGIVPGIHDLDVDLLDGGGARIASMKLKLSVPQCVRVTENATAFDKMLQDAHLSGEKNTLVGRMKPVVEHLLRRANVRVFWQLGGLNEAVPGHVPATNVVLATIKNKDPNGNLGVATGPAAADTFDEKIQLFPGMYAEPNAIDVDTETQALIIQLESSLSADPELTDIATTVFSRLIGETLAHEIGHTLLWDDIPGSGHNSPAIANDIMNSGVDRPFRARTGMENTAQVSPVLPEHYVDHGLNAIDQFQAANQALIDKQWPVPPAFG